MMGFTRSDEEKRLWLRLIRSPGVGPTTFFRLLESLGSAEKIIATLPQLVRKGRLRGGLRLASEAEINAEYRAITAVGGEIITYGEQHYPPTLARARPWAPPLLVVKGHCHLLAKPIIAIVGTRSASANGMRWAANAAAMLGHNGWVVVSGLARGIDAAAHKGALRTGTIAVNAGGVDVVYPPQNEALFNEIVSRGLLASEVKCGLSPRSRDFPRRNRIIAALSTAVVVVEGMLRSGSLITARCAVEYGRDVMAVPGSPYDARAQGCNALIKDGAILVERAEDVLAVVEQATGLYEPPPPRLDESPQTLDPLSDGVVSAREKVMELLSPSPTDTDEIIRHSGLAHPIISYILLELEMDGALARHADNKVSLLPRS